MRVTFKKGYAVRWGLVEGVELEVVDRSGKLWKLVNKEGRIYYADPRILKDTEQCANKRQP
jgi:hypothetical protein